MSKTNTPNTPNIRDFIPNTDPGISTGDLGISTGDLGISTGDSGIVTQSLEKSSDSSREVILKFIAERKIKMAFQKLNLFRVIELKSEKNIVRYYV